MHRETRGRCRSPPRRPDRGPSRPAGRTGRAAPRAWGGPLQAWRHAHTRRRLVPRHAIGRRNHPLEYRIPGARRRVFGGTALARAGSRSAVSGQPRVPLPVHLGERAHRVPSQPVRGRCTAFRGTQAARYGLFFTIIWNVTVVQHSATSVITIERYIIEQERMHPEATGELSGILYDMALAAKMISSRVRRAGLADILGATEIENVRGEIQQKLDVFANETIIKAMDHGGRLCAMASEEAPDIIQIPEGFRCGKYCLLFDPLDGSSNIDVNVPVGTIFSVLRKITPGKHGDLEDMLQRGRRQVAAVHDI